MYILFKNIHHYVGMITLVFVLLLTVVSFIYYLQERPISGQAKKISLLALIFTHTQIVLGIILFFSSPIFQSTSMKDIMGIAAVRRNYIEHPFSMVMVGALITIINAKIKKVPKITVWMLLMSAVSLALVLGMIPRSFWASFLS
ncbi:hypothetical protein Ga0061079_101253 [Apibacter mensalis]|uniref:Cytochrome C and Quinol oxidase polypeptide I n=1 Tax=Apibacter mensalis TaxID=1586267 RepID=A0A0X3AN11_9FLAO|nr:hypothetical protein [Apibacter mensalis]CVK15435.1 hypothetical protein Ga0061079_101253 [Apibacter mensalis]